MPFCWRFRDQAVARRRPDRRPLVSRLEGHPGSQRPRNVEHPDVVVPPRRIHHRHHGPRLVGGQLEAGIVAGLSQLCRLAAGAIEPRELMDVGVGRRDIRQRGACRRRRNRMGSWERARRDRRAARARRAAAGWRRRTVAPAGWFRERRSTVRRRTRPVARTDRCRTGRFDPGSPAARPAISGACRRGSRRQHRRRPAGARRPAAPEEGRGGPHRRPERTLSRESLPLPALAAGPTSIRTRSTPPGVQAPPRLPVGASQITVGEPPATSRRFSWLPAKNARLRPSGDQKNEAAPSEPGTMRESRSSKSRTNSAVSPLSLTALPARDRPSGESASEMRPPFEIGAPRRRRQHLEAGDAGFGAATGRRRTTWPRPRPTSWPERPATTGKRPRAAASPRPALAAAVADPELGNSVSSANARSPADWNRADGILRETAAQEPLQRGLHGAVLGERRRLVLENRRHRLRRPCRARRRACPVEHLVQDGAQARRCRRGDRPHARALARAPCIRPCRARRPASCRRRRGRQLGRLPPGGSGSASLTSPKSRILTWPSHVTNRLSGLMSRWTMPCSCAAASPRAICAAVSRALRTGIAPAIQRGRAASPPRATR